jgi:hypothetical protein
VSTPDRSSVPAHIPADMQERYATEARRHVRASARHRRRATLRGGGPSRMVRLTLPIAILALAAAFGIAASSWVIGTVMLIVLSVVALVGVKVTAIVGSRRAGSHPPS